MTGAPSVGWRDRRRELNAYFTSQELSRRLVPVPELGLLYVKNPKVATSTLLTWLDWVLTREVREADVNVRKVGSLPTARRVGWERTMQLVDGDGFRFSFVRNPLKRFESVYQNKLVEPSRIKWRLAEHFDRPVSESTVITFEEFLTYVESQDPLDMDVHWRPQHLNLMHPDLQLDFIGRLERFDEDFAEVRSRLDLPRGPVQPRNVSATLPASVFDGRPDLVERVRAIYERDFEIYGY